MTKLEKDFIPIDDFKDLRYRSVQDITSVSFLVGELVV